MRGDIWCKQICFTNVPLRYNVEVGSWWCLTLCFWEQQQQQQYCREGRRFRICNQAPVPPCSWKTAGSVYAAMGVCCLCHRNIATIVLIWSCPAHLRDHYRCTSRLLTREDTHLGLLSAAMSSQLGDLHVLIDQIMIHITCHVSGQCCTSVSEFSSLIPGTRPSSSSKLNSIQN